MPLHFWWEVKISSHQRIDESLLTSLFSPLAYELTHKRCRRMHQKYIFIKLKELVYLRNLCNALQAITNK